MKKILGIAASAGIAIGRLGLTENKETKVEKTRIMDVDGELARLDSAREKTMQQLQDIYLKSLKKIGEKDSMIFQIHIMMVQDEDFTEAIRNMIRTEKVCAEYAVWEAGQSFSSQFAAMDDEYMRGRAQDVIDISRRIIRALRNKEDGEVGSDEPRIVGAADLTPSETVQMDKSTVLAFVTRDGSRTAHSAILARTLGIPSVVGIGKGFSELTNGSVLIVDGSAGLVLVEPDEETLKTYREKQRQEEEHREKLKILVDAAAISKGGTRVKVYANIGHPGDADLALENGAEGIGLFRSEFLYMESDSLPAEDTQFNAYKSVLQKMGDRQVIIRTFDIGADKQVPYLNLPQEANPALGYRAIRICLDRKDLFRTQLRALVRASAYGNLSIMFPMIISPEEAITAKKMVEQIKEDLKKENIAFSDHLKLGVMIETPAAAVLSAELAKIVDFFSIGTNDLTQYTLAVDRMNANVSNLYRQRHPAVLNLMEMTFRNAKQAGIEAGVCGESAADPALTSFYLRNRVDELSVTPSSVLELKNSVCEAEE